MKLLHLALIWGLISSCGRLDQRPVVSGREGTSMPGINILLTDSISTFSTTSIREGTPSLLFFFSPTCPFCRIQTKRITANMDKLKNVTICMMANTTLKNLNKFKIEFGLNKYPNVIIGKDSSYSMLEYFESGKVPFLAIYDHRKILKNTYLGALSSKQLIAISSY
jgi:thiol-disulfide isomerase/thioredoxin